MKYALNYIPKSQKSLNVAIIYLNNRGNEDNFKFNTEQFIHMPSNENCICLTTKQNLHFITNNCTEYFGDGTFIYTPKYVV